MLVRGTCTLLGSVLFESSLSSSVSLDGLLITERMVLRSPSVMIALSTSPFSSASFCFLYFGALSMTPKFLSFLKCFYLFVSEGKEKEREKNTNVWLPLTRPLPGTWPTNQGRALPTN